MILLDYRLEIMTNSFKTLEFGRQDFLHIVGTSCDHSILPQDCKRKCCALFFKNLCEAISHVYIWTKKLPQEIYITRKLAYATNEGQIAINNVGTTHLAPEEQVWHRAFARFEHVRQKCTWLLNTNK